MTRSPFLVYVFSPPNYFLIMLPPPPWQAVLLKFPFRGFHLFVLWFRVTVMTRFVFSALRFLVFPHTCVPLLWPMPSWLISIRFVFTFPLQ
jgi:hypothetical protein